MQVVYGRCAGLDVHKKTEEWYPLASWLAGLGWLSAVWTGPAHPSPRQSPSASSSDLAGLCMFEQRSPSAPWRSGRPSWRRGGA